MTITINGSGTITGATTLASTIASPAMTTPTLTTPTMTGAVVSSMGSSVITSGTSQASTSGTSIDFTSIPSWVKRITVMFNGVSTNGTSQVQIQLGAGSVTTSGYYTVASYGTGANQYGFLTSGFSMEPTAVAQAVSQRYGSTVFTLQSANTWVSQGNTLNTASGATVATSGYIALGGALDRVRITTVNGTDAFDAGSINILYE